MELITVKSKNGIVITVNLVEMMIESHLCIRKIGIIFWAARSIDQNIWWDEQIAQTVCIHFVRLKEISRNTRNNFDDKTNKSIWYKHDNLFPIDAPCDIAVIGVAIWLDVVFSVLSVHSVLNDAQYYILTLGHMKCDTAILCVCALLLDGIRSVDLVWMGHNRDKRCVYNVALLSHLSILLPFLCSSITLSPLSLPASFHPLSRLPLHLPPVGASSNLPCAYLLTNRWVKMRKLGEFFYSSPVADRMTYSDLLSEKKAHFGRIITSKRNLWWSPNEIEQH